MKSRLWGLVATITTVLAVTTALSLSARAHWLADLCANLRVQQMIAMAFAMVITCTLRRWRWLAFQVMLFGIHLPWLAPGMRAGGELDASRPDLRVMLANVWTQNRDFPSIVATINEASPDVLVVLELGTDLAQELERSIGEDYPHRLVMPNDSGNFGIALYSRNPIADVQRFHLNDSRIESIAATVTKNEIQFRVFATHPLPPVGSQRFASRNTHLRQLATRIRRYRERNPGIPVILVGDLNVTPWSPIFSDLARDAGLHRAIHGEGLTPTWYARQNFAFGLALDHGLISGELQCVSQNVSDFFGSDHRAVTLGLIRRTSD